MKNILFLLTIIILLVNTSFADGLLMPSREVTQEQYPKDFLKNRSTEVVVDIHGIVAETYVFQEFVNEWYDSTNAVYSFPLPPDARATEFVYWYKDKPYKAVLKVKQQAVNPGTGEGGVAAEVNEYIGRNGIKVLLRGVPAGGIQKIMLRYISLCDFYQGKSTYRFPLNTDQFITYPLEHLQFTINVYSNSAITNYGLPSHPDIKILESSSNVLKVEMVKPKAYLNKDLEFFYEVNQTDLGVDFYSIASDTMDGHFGLFIRPQNAAEQDSVLPKRIIFLLSNSSGMYGYKLNQSIAAVNNSLDQLSARDYFNIAAYNYYYQNWNNELVPATAENIQLAKTYLTTVTNSWGSELGNALIECLKQFPDKAFSNSILVFSDGRSPLNIQQIEDANKYNTGIFPIAIGDDNIDRSRLEMIAAKNYGFVTYIDEEDNLSEKMQRVFNLINQPVMTDISIEYGRADLYSIAPEKLPATYAGSYFYAVGRYKNPGESSLSLAGTSVSGINFYNFHLNFSDKKDQPKFVEYLWAKEMIDNLERVIEIDGETPERKSQLIELSLKYNIRCRYTAYVADYDNEWVTEVEKNENIIIPVTSYISGNYPNPFNPSTKINIYIHQSSEGKVKLLKIYNCLGQLVTVIDLTNYSTGWTDLLFNGKDMYGNTLSSGIYLARLEIEGQATGAIKMNLVK